uniref:Meckelin n=1 Tax=Glossina palpalis gambiensis TaxID=67801 RepID=A0A1B0BKJ5_9MUSC
MCRPCEKWGQNLESSNDKISCVCNASLITTLTIYDTVKERIICGDICQKTQLLNNQVFDNICQNTEVAQHGSNCKYKYINRTSSIRIFGNMESSLNMIEIAYKNWRHDNDCVHCDLHYNFHYQSYCIAKILLRPYLNYDSFWQAATAHYNYNELKFAAFFCISLHNNTACNHLANLCVTAFYAIGKNSPCNRFLLTQASETLYRYGGMDEQLLGREIKPFLYYRKGKEMQQMLRRPIEVSEESLKLSALLSLHNNHLNIFETIYDMSGPLYVWGPMKLNSINLCSKLDDSNFVRFRLATEKIKCFLTLENLIDIASLYGRNRYISWFLNYTTKEEPRKILMQTLPILIEELNKENEPLQGRDWLLVKRFQLIYFYTHQNIKSDLPTYENSYKLSIYRFGRYVERVELHTVIFEGNQIGVPLIKMKYRYLDFSQNLTLDSRLPFEFVISFVRQGEQSINELLNELSFPMLLILTVALTLLRMWTLLRQRQSISASPLSSVNNNQDFCSITLVEFLLQLADYTSFALLIYFLLYVHLNSLIYYTQSYAELTLPLLKGYNYLQFIMCAAAILKLITTFTKFWHLSHFNVFFIDWERPRYSDTNNINLKSNLDTLSACSNAGPPANKSNVSAWRSIFLINEWVRLSSTQQTSTVLQSFATYVAFNIFATDAVTYNDSTLKLFVFTLSSLTIYCLQYVLHNTLITHLLGNPMQIFINHCSLANISIFVLIEPSSGYYIHGRSPNGFTDTDVPTIITQFQRETQSLCERRGLLNNADQCYIIIPPKNLYNYFNKLLLRLQRSIDSASTIRGDNGIFQTRYHKDISRAEGSLEKTSIAYSNINRFCCAFVDHGIKDMDYIIKEKTLLERLLNCELNQHINESTFLGNILEFLYLSKDEILINIFDQLQ